MPVPVCAGHHAKRRQGPCPQTAWGTVVIFTEPSLPHKAISEIHLRPTTSENERHGQTPRDQELVREARERQARLLLRRQTNARRLIIFPLKDCQTCASLASKEVFKSSNLADLEQTQPTYFLDSCRNSCCSGDPYTLPLTNRRRQ